MANTVTVNVVFDPELRDKKILIPEEIIVKKGDKINWVLITQYLRRNELNNLLFELYFDAESPFNWNIGRALIDANSVPDGEIQELAIGIAEREGEYKYGVRAINRDNDEVIYDEDPYLIVLKLRLSNDALLY